MFGSNDDKKTPAPAGEKKGLFGWLRRKPQETVAEQPKDVPAAATEPVVESTVPAAPLPITPQTTAEPATFLSAEEHEVPRGEPWLKLPVPEEPVALTDEHAPHVTPQIPAYPATQVPEPAQALSEQLVSPLLDDTSLTPTQAMTPEAPAPLPIEPAPFTVPPPVETQDLPAFAPMAPPFSNGAPVTVPSTPVPAGLAEPAPLIVTEPELKPQPVVAPVATAPAQPPARVQEPLPVPVAAPGPAPEAKQPGFFARLKQGLSKTSASLGEGMASLFLGKKAIDDDMLEELETRLLTADVGVEATSLIVRNLTQKVARKQLTDSDALYTSLQSELTQMLKPVEAPLVITSQNKPFVILVVGVNGAGKTTTIGKLAKKLQLEGKKVMLAAGDTFRAAAVEQLQVWGERNKIPVIAQHTGADSASVIFDAVQAAKARGIDVLIADTAGRLHTKDNLMEELKKVRRVIGKLDEAAPHEVLLVLDAGTGQNAISQAKQFHQTVQLTGLALTKLDGTAKGGVIFALAKQFGLPIRYIGVGEGIDDLRTFEAEPFVQAIFSERERP